MPDQIIEHGITFTKEPDYATIARESRLKVLDMVYKAQTSHIGSLMGCADILTMLFEKIDFEKDKLVVGKSWAAALIYYHLWRKGKITLEQLDSYCIGDSPFIGLLEPIEGVDLIPFGIGSMGMSFPAAVGLALSKKLKKEEGTVYCFMSDGELQVGTTWESALIAGHPRFPSSYSNRLAALDNLVVIVDRNNCQAMGMTNDILEMGPITSLGNPFMNWRVSGPQGNHCGDIEKYLNWREELKPYLIVAHTTKGKGVSFMENNNLYHYKQLSEDEYLKAKEELHG